MPTKLGLKPGSTIAVEDAIKGIVTRSANDAAVVVAEAIAGDEDAFARLMTRKAQTLGMSRTIYKNASGLPDSGQVTTARDQSILGRAIQERFPRYYKYFSIRTFTFRGQSIGNHNHLLGRVEGVDGIKTGYISASGFNLVTSVHRGNRYLVAVVMGGSSAGSRDARMRDLISDKIAMASAKRTAPMVAEARPPEQTESKAGQGREQSRAQGCGQGRSQTGAEGRSQGRGKAEPKAEAEAESRGPVCGRQRRQPARALQFRAVRRPNPRRKPEAAAAAPTGILAGSTDPIRPVLVKTLSVKAGTQTASLAPLHVPPPAAAEPAPVRAAAPARPLPPPSSRSKQSRPHRNRHPSWSLQPSPSRRPRLPPPVAAKSEEPLPALVTANKPEVPALSFAPIAAKSVGAGSKRAAAAAASPARARSSPPLPPPATPAAKPQHRSGWMIQVGAYPARTGGEAASLRRPEQGGQDAHRRRSVHRDGREGWHHFLSRALCRSRQGQGRSRLQVSQAQRRRMRHHQELTSSA